MFVWEGKRVAHAEFSAGLVQLILGSKLPLPEGERRAILERAIRTEGANLSRLVVTSLALLLVVGLGCDPGPIDGPEGDAAGAGAGGQRLPGESPPITFADGSTAPNTDTGTMPGTDTGTPPPPADTGTPPPPPDSGPTPGDIACRGLADGDFCGFAECAGTGSGNAAGSAFLRTFQCEDGRCVGKVRHCPTRCSGTLVIPRLCQPGTATESARCVDDNRFPNLLEDCGRQNATCQMVNIGQCHPEIASCTAAACMR